MIKSAYAGVADPLSGDRRRCRGNPKRWNLMIGTIQLHRRAVYEVKL